MSFLEFGQLFLFLKTFSESTTFSQANILSDSRMSTWLASGMEGLLL